MSPFVMVIFGATGDLTARKLMPSLYNLLKDGVLPEKFYIIGVGRREIVAEEFKEMMKTAIIKSLKNENIDNGVWKTLEKNIYYQHGFFEEAILYQKLVKMLETFDKEIGACITRFFYLATPPQHYSDILSHLASSRLSEGCGQGSTKWTRVLIEKPFGKDPDTAQKLESQLCQTFEEKQIYRIDHYLAKETIQNILAFRFANRIFEPLWNSEHIDNIQLTLYEASGVGNRGKFYEGIGAMRDVVQNHLMAMLAYTCMDEPKSMKAEDIRNQRVQVLEKIRIPDVEDVRKNVVRGQYGPGELHCRQCLGYRQEKNVDPNSITETFVALKLFVDNNRWQGVPIYIRAGKRMIQSVVQIDVQFKPSTSTLFGNTDRTGKHISNVLSIRVQPREGISIHFFAKKPGLSYNLTQVDMHFSYSHSFNKELDDSYEKLLVDCMLGDQTFFATGQGFRVTWKYVNAILQVWKNQQLPKFPNYSVGSWGPENANTLIEKDGKKWLIIPDEK